MFRFGSLLNKSLHFHALIHAAGAGAEVLEFEAHPDGDLEDLHLRLCRIRIFRVGEALPCVQFGDPKSKETYSKTSGAKTYDDHGRIELPLVCPVNYPYAKEGANRLTAQFVYEMPIENGPASLSTGGEYIFFT